MDSTYLPTTGENSDHSNASNLTYSHQFIKPDNETFISDEEESIDDNIEENHDDDIRTHKRKEHRDIEARRRDTEGKHLRELSSLIKNWYPSKPSKLPQLVLLQMTADLLDNINLHYQHDSLRPSHLTENEVNFLNLEASNAFLFATTIESSSFHIIHVTDLIYRVLYFAPEQWLGEDFLSFIHPDDLFQVQSQLLSFTEQINNKLSVKCRLRKGDNSYSSVMIDGIIKKIDQSSLKPISIDEYGYFAFIGICHLPLINEYNEKNLNIYKNPQLLIFSCRCLPNNWKIFLVDCSISTFPSISCDLYRDKSILDFIYIDDQPYVHQALLNSTLTSQEELITCRFMYSPMEILTMILDIKPYCNQSTKRTEFIELTFKNSTDPIKNLHEIKKYEHINDFIN